MRNPVEVLIQIEQILRSADNGPVAAFFSEGLEKYLSGDVTLDQAFSLTRGTTQRKWSTIHLYLKRDSLLHDAYECCGNSSGPWKKAVELSDDLKKFRQLLWPRLRTLNEPPKDLSRLRTILFRVFKIGLPVPESPRQLFKIVHGY